ncbi:HU-like domain-containing DNA binding protein [Bacillus phage Chotacabras]|nr:HU-like domain-containing DNA binding protein [Bacillus phage Chotacabras]
MTKQITLAKYDTLEATGYEMEVLNYFNEYSGSQYINEVFSQIARLKTPVENEVLWKETPRISEYVEEAIEEGYTRVNEDVLITNIFMSGFTYYFERLLSENEAGLFYNYIAKKVNTWLEGLTYDQREKIDLHQIDERIEHERSYIDNDNYMQDLEDITKRIIAEFKGIVNKDSSWTNYGDVNALEHGGSFIKKDSDYPLEKCYYIVEVIDMNTACGEDGFMVEEAYIDLNDSWIDWEAITESYDIAESDEMKVKDAFSYYGVIEFNGETYKFDNESEVLEHLAAKGICIEN